MQERYNSSVLEMELNNYCANLSIFSFWLFLFWVLKAIIAKPQKFQLPNFGIMQTQYATYKDHQHSMSRV